MLRRLRVGSFGVFSRWMQDLSAFDEHGLYKPGSLSGLMLMLLSSPRSRRLSERSISRRKMGLASRPITARRTPDGAGHVIALVMTVFMAAGGVLLITAGGSQYADLLRVLALLGLVADSGFMASPGRQAIGEGRRAEAGLCLASALPVAFCCFWLVVSYRQDAATGVVWRYAPEIIAIAFRCSRSTMSQGTPMAGRGRTRRCSSAGTARSSASSRCRTAAYRPAGHVRRLAVMQISSSAP